MPNQVVNQQRPPAHAQTFSHELSQRACIEMMREKTATHQIEGIIGKRQGECVGYNAAVSRKMISVCAITIGSPMMIRKMRSRPVQQRDVECDSMSRDFGTNLCWNFTQSRSDFQQREMFRAGRLSDTFNHLLRGGDTAEPAVDASQNRERALGIANRTAAGIENFLCVDSLHGRSPNLPDTPA
jgi:hypothetical protein